MLLLPPLTGTKLSPVAPGSWVLRSGHIPGNRHDRRAIPDVVAAWVTKKPYLGTALLPFSWRKEQKRCTKQMLTTIRTGQLSDLGVGALADVSTYPSLHATARPGFTQAGDMEEPSPSDSQSTGQPLVSHSTHTAHTLGRRPSLL
ncbi:unnamed protein product [Schistocephalus solidus]|uniref:Uncharacterized protein n=1 Tax=Schistocephalus solidus TaxID=70667 RepID=A0A183SK40_SCHSO|nr:unnamed protein product [Schistocephalus solidus]